MWTSSLTTDHWSLAKTLLYCRATILGQWSVASDQSVNPPQFYYQNRITCRAILRHNNRTQTLLIRPLRKLYQKEIMSLLKKSVLASVGIQIALVLSGLILYCLPHQAGQNFMWMLFPFVVGLPLTPGALLSGLCCASLPVNNRPDDAHKFHGLYRDFLHRVDDPQQIYEYSRSCLILWNRRINLVRPGQNSAFEIR